jgi:hypothetical protein
MPSIPDPALPQAARWPDLPYAAWRDTCATLHLWCQMVGKIRLAQTPWINHSWHVTLYPTARGLTTSPIPYRGGTFQIEFDFIAHVLRIDTAAGNSHQFALAPMPVADFHRELFAALASLDITPVISTMPTEIADAVPFQSDHVHAAYDRDHARRFWRVLLSTSEVFTAFRSGFVGKTSPVHFFWGSFDLAVTRFSGRQAPRHPGGVPHLADAVVREAYSHEVSSAGFWPGGGVVDYHAFYSYAWPAPDGFADAPVRPQAAFFATGLGEFVLPYDAVRTAADPEGTLMEFLDSTYEAAAALGHWDRAALERPRGAAGTCPASA